MQAFFDFKLLAHAALRSFNVNIECYYGSRGTATASGVDCFYVSVNGQGLPPGGFEEGRESGTAAIDAVVRMIKAHRREAEQAQIDRDRARRTLAAEADGC